MTRRPANSNAEAPAPVMPQLEPRVRARWADGVVWVTDSDPTPWEIAVVERMLREDRVR